ncbi:MAG: hypothetical protein QXT19_00750 [Candidatus Woesearchaeota archaeon]
MAEAIPGADRPSGWGVFILAFLLVIWHVFDLLVIRRQALVSYTILAVTFGVYAFLALVAKGIMKEKDWKFTLWFLAMWLVPIFLGLVAKYMKQAVVLEAITMAVIYFPLFIFYFLTRGVASKTIAIYFIIWTFGLVFWAVTYGNLVNYAKEQNIELGFNPMLSYEAIISWTKRAIMNMYTRGKEAGKFVATEVETAIRAAKGDYYTGQVDSAAKKQLGVYIENFRPTEPFFYDNSPVSAYATLKAETLDKPLDISVACDADGTIPANILRPKNTFNIITAEQHEIDCVWNKGVLKKGLHKLRIKAEFEFTTRAYIKAYIMDRDRLREYRKQNIDPLANIPDKTPVTIYTSGPVRIGMSLGQQPIGIGAAGEALQTWGITVENLWDGQLEELSMLYFFVPKGIKISRIEGIDIKQTSCAAIPKEEQPACDDSLVNVYSLYPGATRNFRIPLEVTNPDQVLGKAPVAVQNFKVSAQYKYLLERTVITDVRETKV